MDAKHTVDWSHSTPEELESSLARTRDSLERHLGMLKERFGPKAGLRKFGLPVALGAAALAAAGIAWKLTHRERHARPKAAIRRLRVRGAGIADQIRALGMLAGMIRKGKPAIYIVEPRG